MALLDAADHVLLVEHADERSSWWVLPGGGVEAGETHEIAAQRELWEETGLRAVVGSAFYERRFDLDLVSGPVDQIERYFVARTAALAPAFRLDASVALEGIRGAKWWSLDELRSSEACIYPEGLAHLLSSAVTDRARHSAGQRAGRSPA